VSHFVRRAGSALPLETENSVGPSMFRQHRSGTQTGGQFGCPSEGWWSPRQNMEEGGMGDPSSSLRTLYGTSSENKTAG
jgi:hypothetical protein